MGLFAESLRSGSRQTLWGRGIYVGSACQARVVVVWGPAEICQELTFDKEYV
jgi:hypothetical protein